MKTFKKRSGLLVFVYFSRGYANEKRKNWKYIILQDISQHLTNILNEVFNLYSDKVVFLKPNQIESYVAIFLQVSLQTFYSNIWYCFESFGKYCSKFDKEIYR